MAKSSSLIKIGILTLALLLVSAVRADDISIRSDAPKTYVVVKGDTLWDISSLFLNKPWLWPELWRTNTQIENPHLIYPGDVLRLRYENGQPVLEVVRDKPTITLTPDSKVTTKPSPISVLPWRDIEHHLGNGSLMDAVKYQSLPVVLGDQEGSPRFTNTDYVLAHNIDDTKTEYKVVRKEREVFDSLGKNLGVQVSYLSDASVTESLSQQRQIVKIHESKIEAKKGDKLVPIEKMTKQDLRLNPAQRQVGELVQNINGNVLIGAHDVVIINIGARQVKPGTVFGIYEKGEDISYDKESTYALTKSSIVDLFKRSEQVEQPAFKVGELVVIRSFEDASYAWVTKTNTHLTGGEIIAKP